LDLAFDHTTMATSRGLGKISQRLWKSMAIRQPGLSARRDFHSSCDDEREQRYSEGAFNTTCHNCKMGYMDNKLIFFLDI